MDRGRLLELSIVELGLSLDLGFNNHPNYSLYLLVYFGRRVHSYIDLQKPGGKYFSSKPLDWSIEP